MDKFEQAKHKTIERGFKHGYFLKFESEGKTFVTLRTLTLGDWSFDVNVYEAGDHYYVVYNDMLLTRGYIEAGDARRTWEKDYNLTYFYTFIKLSFATNDRTLYDHIYDNYSVDMLKLIPSMLLDTLKGGTRYLFGKMTNKKAV